MKKTQTQHHTCKNCGNQFTGKYCNHCGEKIYDEHDKKVSHLLEEAFHFSTHFDNKFFRSLKLVFFKPGFVSHEFCEGKRKKYYSPFSMFLVAIFLYLLFPKLQGLNISFHGHLVNNNAWGLNFQHYWAKAKAAAEHITLQQLGEKFDHLSPKIAKVMLIIIAPLCALALAFVFRRKKRYFFDHFIFSSEFNSFYILFIFFFLPIIVELLSVAFGSTETGDSSILFIALGLGILFIVSVAGIKRFYQLRTAQAMLRSVLFLLFHSLIVFIIYRMLLFSVVMLFI